MIRTVLRPLLPGPIMKLRHPCTSPRLLVSTSGPLPRLIKVAARGRGAHLPDTGRVSEGRVVPRSSNHRRSPAGPLPQPAGAPVSPRPHARSPRGRMELRRALPVPTLLLVLGESPAPSRRRGRDSGCPGRSCHFPPGLQGPPLPTRSLLRRGVRSFPPAADGMRWGRGAGTGVQYAFRSSRNLG